LRKQGCNICGVAISGDNSYVFTIFHFGSAVVIKNAAVYNGKDEVRINPSVSNIFKKKPIILQSDLLQYNITKTNVSVGGLVHTRSSTSSCNLFIAHKHHILQTSRPNEIPFAIRKYSLLSINISYTLYAGVNASGWEFNNTNLLPGREKYGSNFLLTLAELLTYTKYNILSLVYDWLKHEIFEI
jgi:hypothetical protein